MYFLHAINSDRQTRLPNVLGQIAMILEDKIAYNILFVRLQGGHALHNENASCYIRVWHNSNNWLQFVQNMHQGAHPGGRAV